MITITKDKIYRSPFSLKHTNKDSLDVEELDLSNIIYALGEEVELGIDVVFETVFDIIIHNKDFFNVLFYSEMGGILIDDFIQDYKKEEKPKTDETKEKYDLKIKWYSDIYEYDGEIDYFDYVSFEGYGKLDTESDEEDYSIGIGFTSMCDMKDKLLTIDNSFDIYNMDEEKSENDRYLFKSSYRPITVYDMVKSILSEITFYGRPKERNEHLDELEKRMSNIDSFDAIEFDDDFEFNLDDSILDDELVDEFDEKNSYWNKLYPDNKNNKENKHILNNESETNLKKQLKEAVDSEEYEVAAKIKKLIDKKKSGKK